MTDFLETRLPSFRANAVEITRPAKKKWPITAGATAALVAILTAAMIPLFNRGRVPLAKPAAASAPTMTTIERREDVAPTRVHSMLTVPTSIAAEPPARRRSDQKQRGGRFRRMKGPLRNKHRWGSRRNKHR